MVAEEDGEIGHAIVIEMAQVKCEGAHREQEDHDEHEGQGRREIGFEFPCEDGAQRAHAVAPAVSRVVSWRKTSSSRPVVERAASAAGVSSATTRPWSMITARVQMA